MYSDFISNLYKEAKKSEDLKKHFEEHKTVLENGRDEYEQFESKKQFDTPEGGNPKVVSKFPAFKEGETDKTIEDSTKESKLNNKPNDECGETDKVLDKYVSDKEFVLSQQNTEIPSVMKEIKKKKSDNSLNIIKKADQELLEEEMDEIIPAYIRKHKDAPKKEINLPSMEPSDFDFTHVPSYKRQIESELNIIKSAFISKEHLKELIDELKLIVNKVNDYSNEFSDEDKETMKKAQEYIDLAINQIDTVMILVDKEK